jgi:Fe-S-cluster containining protein
MKSSILHKMYKVFADWSQNLAAACTRGCSACCTQNVTITATEGEDILRYVIAENLSLWMAGKLAHSPTHRPATITNNDFAAACLEGRDANPGDHHHNTSPCPFLEDNFCRIYPARPFACRLFISAKKCSATQPAMVPDYYFEAATAVAQLVEHLGQREYWGNMLDVLPALLDMSQFREIAGYLEQTRIIEARLHSLTAKPLPGFLLSEEAGGKVTQLLESVFTAEVDGKRVEDILNGR